MLNFKRFQDGLYLIDADLSDPAQARVGFLFQDGSFTNPTFSLSQKTWTDPQLQGYFAFFVPSASRNWSAFANAARRLFEKTETAQLGWFTENQTSIAAATLVLIGEQGTDGPFISQPFSLTFASNITFTVQASPFTRSVVSFDDGSNSFVIQNPLSQVFQLTAQPPNQQLQTFLSSSPNLILPLDRASTPHAASVSAAFQFTTQDLRAFEAGFLYFQPGTTNLLTALSYPLVRAPGGAATTLHFTAWLDVLQPLVDTRSYFEFTDPVVGSYLTAASGQAFALATVNGLEPDLTSRFAFANRPVEQPSDTGTYYLTPAGSFRLAIDSASATSATADLLCGITGTEFLRVAVAPGGADTLILQTGQPAFQPKTPAKAPGHYPTFLDSVSGNVTTSWARLATSSGSYVSQPQEAPLYRQSANQAANIHGTPPASGLTVYLLDFLPLPTWTAGTKGGLAPVHSPLIPLVPYAGLLFSTADQAAPYLAMESMALNPTRNNAFTAAQALSSASSAGARGTPAPADSLTYAMTPQGLLAGLDAQQQWQSTRLAISPSLLPEPAAPVILQFTAMGSQIRQALQQNQIFLIITTLIDATSPLNELFSFTGPDQTVNIAGWPFSLSPMGTPASDGTPPIIILKFYPGQSIKDLVADTSFWSQPDAFNGTGFTAEQAQAYIQQQIQQACESVYGPGNCPDGNPSGQPDQSSIYYNFYQVVSDPTFSGLLALNCNIQLSSLPTAIRAVTGGMTYPGQDGKPVSSIEAFRVHHVGVAINDTAPDSNTPALAQSSLFGLVDYEKPDSGKTRATTTDPTVSYNFEVEYLRALFTNSALSNFACVLNLTINELFDTDVEKDNPQGVDAGDGNIIVITGSYQAHSTSGDDTTSGEGVYSFISEGNYPFKFGTNPYLDTITLTKLQFAFDQETPVASLTDGARTALEPSLLDVAATTRVTASFGIWGSLVFKEFKTLDIFAFQQLVFADLGIAVSFDLTTPPSPQAPYTANLELSFNPGNLRLDLANSTPKKASNSLLELLPFKLTSFLYNQYPEQQTLEDLQFYSLSAVPLDVGFSLVDRFNYALMFELDLGTLGALVGSLEAFKFRFLIGWLNNSGSTSGGLAFGVQLPQADGKLEIKIEGVLDLVIEEFKLQYVKGTGLADASPMLVLALHNSSIEILGKRMPPGAAVFDLALFAPTDEAARIGWIAAINNTADGGNGPTALRAGEGEVFELLYLGLGQRVGPDPSEPLTNFQELLDFMTTQFWDAVKNDEYDKVYHPGSQWLALTNFKLLGIIEVGFVFYDSTPFYSLTLNVAELFDFEITYTKVSDSIGLFYANFALPDTLRTFQVGAASLTLPSIGVSVYTNGNWKLDLGFPAGDDWSRSFRVEAQAGPIPVTGSGGFYIASLSSATSSIFQGEYASIIAFGFAARLGVGKDFTSGPLKAGVSVTFFGIMEGAAGYQIATSNELFKQPDALSLSGQFGIIGELYGALDFVIIKASINVRLQASIGLVLQMERSIPGSGSILLYIEASVSVSVSVEIDLFLFSITISFSFNASFRFEWELLPAGSSSALLEAKRLLRQPRLAPHAGTLLPLILGFTTAIGLWYLPEGTTVFPATTGTGTPWVVSSLGIEYDNQPPAKPVYSQFKPFEKITTQLITWAIGRALQVSGYDYPVTLTQLSALDQSPEALIGWIDYPTLLKALAVFTATTVALPSAAAGSTLYAATFPMPPFLRLQTQGRHNGAQPDELDYVFSTKNNVPATYIGLVDAYFNQLLVNQSSSGSTMTATPANATIPLIQEIFLNYFTGLIRTAVHLLLETMQDASMAQSGLVELVSAAVGNGQFAALAGQLSAAFRGGARLPYTPGLTIPGGEGLTTTNPQYALLWQEFPVGGLDPVSNKYTIKLSNPDATQSWLTSSVNWDLTSSWLQPLIKAQATDIHPPSAPVQLPFTNVGPQAFSFSNPVSWTQPDGSTASLRPFASALQRLQATLGTSISALIESRAAGAPYLAGGTPLVPGSFTWATQITLKVSRVPGDGGSPLPDVFALNGASQSDQQLLEQLLSVMPTQNPIASMAVLYQTSAGAAGLTSQTVKPADVFVLRTNTTTISAPPSVMSFISAVAPGNLAEVPVGAQIDDSAAFLQIIQQAAVTNATGYYLRYRDANGKSLPDLLFSAGGAPLTILITYVADGQLNTPASPAHIRPFYNAVVLGAAQPALIYYAETTDAALNTQYSSVAAGVIGVLLTRDDSVMLVQPRALLAAACGVQAGQHYRRSELVKALIDCSVTNEKRVRELLTESGSTTAQLNALYSLITYQVGPTSGFVQSNLSTPIQPQQPDGNSSAADGLASADGQRSYRVYVPLYNLAQSNQPPPPIPNRYSSIGSLVTIDFFQNDSFGNQMPAAETFRATNYYYDPIVSLDQWQGLVSAYDFKTSAGPQANTFTTYLNPSASAFQSLTADQIASALQVWTTIADQITGPGTRFVIETNLALQSDGSMAQLVLSPAQVSAIVALVGKILAYLQQPTSPPPSAKDAVALTAKVMGTAALPPAFELVVLFCIQRDPSLISPLLKDSFGNVTFPAAQNATTSIVATVGSAKGDGTAVNLIGFAADFVTAFPQLTLAVGRNGVGSAAPSCAAARSRSRLRSLGLPGDGSGAVQAGQQPLWAVQQVLLDLKIGVGADAGPRFLSPKPLDNSLNTSMVPLPELPAQLIPANWPAQQLFTDVDLDRLNAGFFQAVDDLLAPRSAAQAFATARAAYSTIANGRRLLATRYSANEVDWLFGPQSPFTGTVAQLAAARETFEQQMRAALATAYSTDTLVQYTVSFASPLLPSVGDLFSLYGTLQPTGGVKLPQGYTLSSPQLPVTADGPSLLTFLVGVADVRDTASIELDLEYNITHLEHFLEPANQVPDGETRPSIWLQLVNPYPASLPHVGPVGTSSTIPFVFREYPTPPTLISQQAMPAPERDALPANTNNPLVDAAAWHLTYSYQVQPTVHDLIISAITYNTDMSASSSGPHQPARSPAGPALFTLFESLARFSAAYPVLARVLTAPTDANWSLAAQSFASLVEAVVNNTTWTPAVSPLGPGRPLPNITDVYTITDVPQAGGAQLITLSWDDQESSFQDVKLSIQALTSRTLQPYADQVHGTVSKGITDVYTPVPAPADDWVVHQIEVDNLNVLYAENALAAVQIERNLIQLLGPDGTPWQAQSEFVYKTPVVRATQPITPFIDNSTPINVATLPEQGIGTGCPQAPSSGAFSLCQRIYTMMYDLLAAESMLKSLLGSRVRAGLDEEAPRRVKVACSFQYPVSSAGGVVSANPVVPLVPVVLARSFVIDGTRADQLSDFANLYATAVSTWATDNSVTFGNGAQSAAQLVFDITLYAQLSGLNTPVLRLQNLQLRLADITQL